MRAELEEQLALVQRELREVELQEAAGELDVPTAERLKATYRGERAAIEEKLLATDPPPAESRDLRRVIVGAIILIVAFAVVVVAAVQALQTDSTPSVIGSDLSEVSNETMLAVIEANASNPQINSMRLALAERYFEAFDYSAALPQFQAVLSNDPTRREASEALARMGWMVHASGESELAEGLLTQSLEENPANTEAQWFLSIVFVDTGRPCESLEVLTSLGTDPAVPEASRSDVAELTAVAEAACER